MNTRLTIEQLERMKTHELADLLANVVLLLRRLPNIECRELTQQPPQVNFYIPAEEVQSPSPTAPFTPKDLEGKTVDELKKFAKELHMSLPAKVKKKAEIINWLLERSTNRHSEQYAIQNV